MRVSAFCANRHGRAARALLAAALLAALVVGGCWRSSQ